MERKLAMRSRFSLLPLTFCTLLALSTLSASGQTVVTFDDLPETGSGTLLASPYYGLTWGGFYVNNAILYTNILPHEIPSLTDGLSGNYYGMVSPSNVALMAKDGGSGEIYSASNFNFFSAYLTGEWNNNLNIEVQGFSGTNLLYDQIVVASATNATLFTFSYLDIDRLVFSGSGGQPAFGLSNQYSSIIMDNFTFEFVPEPSSLLLAALGGVSLVPFLRRRRW
jgi:hypothetical protein